MANPKEAAFRIVRYEGAYRVEVLDKPINWWYIVASKMTWEQAVKWCEERYIEDQRISRNLTAEDIKRIVNIADELLQDANANDKYISEEQYYEEVLKRYNNEQ